MRRYHNLKKALLEYCREEGIRLVDIKKELLEISLDLHNTFPIDSMKQQNNTLLEFHQKLVQETINFINGNTEIKELISAKREVVKDNIMKESGISYNPEISVGFRVDCLDDSLTYGEWVPSTDSSLDISVGGVNVVFSA